MRGSVPSWGQAPPAHGAGQPDPWGGYAAQQGYGNPWGAPPVAFAPPKRSALPAILLGGGAVVVVLVLLAAGAFVVLGKPESSTASGRTTQVTSALETTDEAGVTTTRTRRTSATRTRTTSSTPTAPPTPTGPAALGDNPLFSDPEVGLAKQACRPVGWPKDSAAGKPFFESVGKCLNTAWAPLVTAAGLEFHTGAVVVPTGTKINSPCGVTNMETENVAAFYCSSDETLYMPVAGFEPERYGNQPLIYIGVFAHEFGHHIQNITGILDEENKQERANGRKSAAGLEISRRTELEAQCFSGMFVGSIVDSGGPFTQDDYKAVLKDSARGDRPGDDRDHGTSDHSRAWWNQGYTENAIGDCNTWRATSADVE